MKNQSTDKEHRDKFKQRVFQLLKDKPPVWPQLAQDGPKWQDRPKTPLANQSSPRRALDPCATIVEAPPNAAAFNLAEFQIMVRRLANFQARLKIGDNAFCGLHPKLGSASSWRILKLLAREKELNLGLWFGRLKEQCQDLESRGINWVEPTGCIPASEQEMKLQAQELFLKIEEKRQEKKISLSAFCRNFQPYTGDPATWIRMRKGNWHLISLDRRLPRLQHLARVFLAN